MKKYKQRDPEFGNMLINKALEKYNVTIDEVKANQEKIREETGKEWYQFYTFDTEEEYNNWKSFCIDAMMKQRTPKLTRKRAESEFAWFDLKMGLTQKYLLWEKYAEEHLLKSGFSKKSNSLFSGFNSTGVDIKLVNNNEVVVYVYDEDNHHIMTILGKIDSIEINKHD